MKTMDRILVILAVFLLIFIVVMVGLFICYQSVPDALIVSVFAACGLEGGVMGWIKTTKDRLRKEQEDESEQEEEP